MQKKGNKYGTHRVIEPQGLLTQAAKKIDNTMECWSNEILCDVSALNIDSASFTQIYEACGKDLGKTEQMILDIVNERGKMQNPVTGSGGMFIGTVKEIGEDLQGKIDLKVGDKIASLVSLSLTPLKIGKIKAIHPEIDRVEVEAQAILFESGLYAKLPDDMSEELALAALDVAGAPAQTAKLVQAGDSVLILGGAGKGGMMCCYEAMKRVGPTGKVVALVICQADADLLKSMHLCHEAIVASATDPMDVLEKSLGGAKKGGETALNEVYDYAEKVTEHGLVFMNTPGYDPVATTGQVAGGATMVAFTTGRGSCFGGVPSPVLKLASNTPMYQRMEGDMDINCGVIIDGEKDLDEMGQLIFERILQVASGDRSKSELLGVGENEFVPWPIGVLA